MRTIFTRNVCDRSSRAIFLCMGFTIVFGETTPSPAISQESREMPQELENVIFHQTNAPANTAGTTQLELSLVGFDQIVHHPYRPDLAPMECAVFLHVNSHLRAFLNSKQLHSMQLGSWTHCGVIMSMISGYRDMKCIQLGGVRFEKERNSTG